MIKPYPAYKESNINWYKEIPSHWKVDRLKWSILFCKNGVWGSEADGNNDLACIRVADFDRIKLNIYSENLTFRSFEENDLRDRLLKRGDLLLEKSGGGEKQLVGAVVFFNLDIPSVNSNFIARMPVDKKFDSKFLAYLHYHLYSSKVNYRSIKQTTGIQNLDSQQYLDEKVAFPPKDEQQSIAAFLDYKTTQLDTLIQKKEKLLELLSEKRIALITNIVTGKLSPFTKGGDTEGVPMKPSNIPWLGNIPQHWVVKRLKFSTYIKGRVGWHGLNSKEFLNDGNYYLVTGTEFLNGTISWDSCYRISEDRYFEDPYIHLREDDLLITKDGTIGKIAIVKQKPEYATLNSGVFVTRPHKKEYLTKFLYYILSSKIFQEFILLNKTGTTINHLYQATFENFSYAFPPNISEQQRIIDYLDKELVKIDKLSKKIEENIGYLKEYRTSLITSAVTGKIDLRNWQPPAQGEESKDEVTDELLQSAEEELK